MITGKKFNEGIKWLKENYNLKDFSPVTTKVWFEILKSESITDKQYERCVRIIIKTIPNWYQAGESLASRVLAVLPQANQELRSAREYLEQKNQPKELPIDEVERRKNLELLSKSWKKTLSKLQMPRVEGESTSDRTERISREVNEEMKTGDFCKQR